MEKILLFLSLFSCLQAKAQVDTNSYSGSVTAFKTVHLQVVDTIPASYMGGEFTLKYVDNGGDTAYEYNHVEYVRRRESKQWQEYAQQYKDNIYVHSAMMFAALGCQAQATDIMVQSYKLESKEWHHDVHVMD